MTRVPPATDAVPLPAASVRSLRDSNPKFRTRAALRLPPPILLPISCHLPSPGAHRSLLPSESPPRCALSFLGGLLFSPVRPGPYRGHVEPVSGPATSP